jgi:NADPH-dependent 2,4-dienoyl-CoA reductase/sulfur reductase-like enzyme
VTPRLQSSEATIFAAGNCAETVHRVSNRPIASALGTSANKQGRIAGENLAGRVRAFPGVLESWVVRIFGLTVGCTGLTERSAAECGFHPVAVQIESSDRARYMPGAAPVTVRALADRRSGTLLGVQAAGAGAERRIDVGAVALWNGMTVDEAAHLDLSYAPPYSQVWDPFLVAMNTLLRYL